MRIIMLLTLLIYIEGAHICDKAICKDHKGNLSYMERIICLESTVNKKRLMCNNLCKEVIFTCNPLITVNLTGRCKYLSSCKYRLSSGCDMKSNYNTSIRIDCSKYKY